MARKIHMEDAVRADERAARNIESWLRSFEETVFVRNVEDDPEYQSKDIDLVCYPCRLRETGSKPTF